MNQVSEGGTSDTPLNIPMKRKRGRPRKDRTLIPGQTAAAPPPGFARAHQTPTLQLDAVEDASDTIVGQAVTGVVESVFDAGYCLSVRIGNSSTQLRGLVFKPGHYVPVSPDNDIAPHVQMLRRNEVEIPTRKQGRPRGRHARSKQVNLGRTEVGQLLNGSSPSTPQAPIVGQPAETMGSKGKEVTVASPISAAPPVGSRGTFLPVLLQPATASNGSPPINPVPGLGQAQTSDRKISESNKPLSVEPLRAVHSDSRNNQGKSFPDASDRSKIGGMSVLLQALQENMTE